MTVIILKCDECGKLINAEIENWYACDKGHKCEQCYSLKKKAGKRGKHGKS
jgi:hypothetical protein